MSDTPLTDKLLHDLIGYQPEYQADKFEELARALERRNKALREALERCLSQLDGYESDDDLTCMSDEGDKDRHYKLITRTSARAALKDTQ